MSVMLRRAVIVPLLLLLAGPARADTTRVGREQTISKETQSGRPVRIRTYTAFHRDCRALPPPQVVIRKQPDHGTVSTEIRDAKIDFVGETAADCTGYTIPGTAVIYSPQPGYRGADRFEFDVILDPSPRHDTAVIEVR